MRILHDISRPLDENLPVWPGSAGFETTQTMAISEGDDANVTSLTMDLHCGTHLDAPLHFVDGGDTIDRLGLDPFFGPVLVIDTGDATEITADVLRATGMPPGATRLLFRTKNSFQLTGPEFAPSYVALTDDAAELLLDEYDLKLVGIDYLSIQRFHDPPSVHRRFLGSGVAILEGLALADVTPGWYELVCMPLRLTGVEAAPARAVLLSNQPGSS